MAYLALENYQGCDWGSVESLISGFREEKKNSILRSGLRPQGSGYCPLRDVWRGIAKAAVSSKCMQGCDSVSRQPSLRWVGVRDELRLEFFFSCVTAAFQNRE